MSKAFDSVRRGYTGLALFLLNTLLLFGVMLLMLEGAASLILKMQASAATSAANVAEAGYNNAPWKEQYFKDVGAYVAVTGGKQVYEPYSLWKNPDFTSQTFNVVGGYRKTVNPSAQPNDSITTIVLLGGSTMFCADVPDEWTVASQVSKKLHTTFPGKKFRVANYGLPGFVCEQEVILLNRLLVSGKRPNIVIFYDGVNDTRLKVGQAKPMPHGFYELYDQIYRSIKERLWATLVWKSSLLTLVMRSRTDEQKFEKDEAVLKTRSEVVLKDYANNVEFVNNLGQLYKFKTAFFWQPSLLTTQKLLPPEEKALRDMSLAQFGTFYGVMQTVINATIFTNPSFPHKNVYDLTNTLNSVADVAFLDSVHLTFVGNEAVATGIVDVLTKHEYIQP